MRVCVVIPAYNEGKVIKSVIKKARKEFEKTKHEIDIVLINDGSADNTADEAKKAGAIIINHILNSGAGGATATGLSFANQNNYDLAITMDADGQHSPKDVVLGIEFALKNDIDLAIGSRLIDSRGMSRVKILGNKGLSFITYILFGVNVTDSQSGLRVYSRKALEQLRWKTSGYEFCSEMIWRANQLHLKIAEYPIEAIYTDYSRAKGQNNWNAINIVKSLVAQRISEIFE
ncbi:MAG: glycosyltransferase family 2 protein [Candidatus Nanogingivalis sp.]